MTAGVLPPDLARPDLARPDLARPDLAATGLVPTDLVMVKGAYDRAGGPETVLQMIVGNLDRARHRPLLALLARPGQALPDVLANVAASVPTRRLAWSGLAGAPLAAWRLAGLLAERPGAILHTNDMRADLLGYLVTRVRRVPWVAHVHGWLGETHAGRHKIYEQVDRRLIAHAGLVLVGSNAMAAECRAAGARWVEVVSNGIPARDGAAYDAAAAAIRADLAAAGILEPGGLVVGMLGRLHPGKGHALLLDAVARLRAGGLKLAVLFVGEGPAEAAYRAQADSLGLAPHVRFAGLVDDPLPYLRAMDITCVPSLKDSLPLTALEAMSVGRPVVASRAGDLPLAITDGQDGLLVAVGSSAALEAAVRRLAEAPALRERLGAAGHATLVARYTPQAMLAQLQGFCDALILRTGHTRPGAQGGPHG